MDYCQSLGSFISDRDKRKPLMEKKNITAQQSNHKETTEEKFSIYRRSSTYSRKKKQEPLIEKNKHN